MKKITQKLLLFTFFCFCAIMSFAQQREITGTVKDSNGAPVANASVIVKGTPKGVATNAEGYFTITVNSPKAVLVISSVDFKTREIPVGDRSSLNVVIQSSSTALNEVVVTALGITREKRSLGYSEQQIKGTELAESNAPNVINALSGRMAGVNITSPNGVDGGSTRILIGGNNTIQGDNQPLIIIDGMPMDNTIPTAAQDVTAPKDWGSAINLINPQDIATFSVLKGPAAAALYGGRGANGVILY